MTEFDADGNGLIDFEEFLVLIQTVVRRVHASLAEVIKICQSKSAARKPMDIGRVARYISLALTSYSHTDMLTFRSYQVSHLMQVLGTTCAFLCNTSTVRHTAACYKGQH